MDFDKSKVYTALNADELKVGSKVAFADSLSSLKRDVREERFDILEYVRSEEVAERFVRKGGLAFSLCYLVSKSEPDWDYIVYLNRRIKNPDNYYLTACRSDTWEQVQKDYGAKTKLFEGTEKECEYWYTARKHLANIIAQWEDGKDIQIHCNGVWRNVCNLSWDIDTEYRVKPESSLKWTDLKVGDILKNKTSGETRMVTGIMPAGKSVCLANYYTNDLDEWEKVE